jgi:SAM-dependent methyltransferase
MPDLNDIAKSIKDEWERRARSPSREFFVASHEGWDTPASRDAQARIDVEALLRFIDLGDAARREFLEIGCGSGRLAPHFAACFRSYTGFDISPTMVQVARERCGSIPNARFFESDGISVPEGARDRLYDYAFAPAVLIHCPRDVCEALVSAAMRQLGVGGELRIQVFADENDPEGITPGPDAGIVDRANKIQASASAAQSGLIVGTHYDGHRFRFAEAQAWLRSVGQARLFRFDQYHIYAIVVRRA